MGTKRQHKFPYAIYYTDGSYMIYELREIDYQAIVKAKMTAESAVDIPELGFIATVDIRSIIKQKPEPKPKQAKLENGDPDLTVEELEWMRRNKAAWMHEDEEEFTQ
jgi:hypothetical protein